MPYSKTNFLKLERAQGTALRIILGLKRHTKYETTLFLAGVSTMATRLELLKIGFYEKLKTMSPSLYVFQIFKYSWSRRNTGIGLASEIEKIFVKYEQNNSFTCLEGSLRIILLRII